MRFLLATTLCTLALFAADPVRRAPGFALVDASQRLHDLADHRGQVVIVEFMQTTCPHCGAFASILETARAKYGNRIAILSISNPPDDLNRVKAFIAEHHIGYPVLFDSGQVAYSYLMVPAFDLPQVFLVDAQGMIRSHFGYSAANKAIFEGNGLMTEIDRMLGVAAPPQKK